MRCQGRSSCTLCAPCVDCFVLNSGTVRASANADVTASQGAQSALTQTARRLSRAASALNAAQPAQLVVTHLAPLADRLVVAHTHDGRPVAVACGAGM
jgi:hypothetical protein